MAYLTTVLIYVSSLGSPAWNAAPKGVVAQPAIHLADPFPNCQAPLRCNLGDGR